MGKSTPQAPAAPDPNVVAGAQTQSNLQTAIANARLNRVNQTTPWGSINYTEGPVDANGVPTWSSNIQLSPQQQQLLDQQQGMAGQRNTIAGNLLNQASGQLSRPLDLSHLHSIYDRGSNYGGAVNTPTGAPSGGGKGASGQPPAPTGSPGGGKGTPTQPAIPLGQQAMASMLGTPALQKPVPIAQQAIAAMSPSAAPGQPPNPMEQLQKLMADPNAKAQILKLLGVQ